jgi:hypothetical protein
MMSQGLSIVVSVHVWIRMLMAMGAVGKQGMDGNSASHSIFPMETKIALKKS